ncbi:MAG: hydrogenase iron-sulfur subunit [Candidatus Helarchaeales archaeon]
MRIGVFICHCGSNIAGVIDIPRVVEEIKKLPDVEVLDNEYMCSESGLLLLKEQIKEKKLDRIVIGACSPKMHENLFRNQSKEAGLNPYLVEIANIREQDSWVHKDLKELATKKAIDLIKMAIAKARYLEPLEKKKVPVEKSALIIGGGVAGIQAALGLAESGIKVYLVEKSPSIGGHMAQYDKTFPTLDCAICILAPLMVEAAQNPNIEIITNASVEEVKGFVGNFQVTVLKKPRYTDPEKCTSGCIEDCSMNCPIDVPDEFNHFGTHKAIYIPFPQAIPLQAVINDEYCIGCRNCEVFCKRDAIDYNQKPERINIKVGAIIVATGFETFDPTILEEYGYGRYTNVITALEFERILTPFGPTEGKLIRPSDGKEIKRVVFIQCVGSRDERINHPYCSRVCCMYAMKQALQIKEQIPDADVTICYIDVRAVGKGYEEFYVRLKEEYNVRFVRGKVSEILEDLNTKDLMVRLEDTLLCRPMEIDADLVILSVGMEPSKGSSELAKILKISRTNDGFFQSTHPKLHPSETATQGIFVAGCAQGPKEIEATTVHASRAALKAVNILSRGEVEIDPIAPIVDHEKCRKCKLCINLCDSNAIEFKDGKIVVNEAACIGCGVCAAGCPSGALSQPGYTFNQIMANLEAIDEKNEYPLIIGFFCNWCAYAAADLAGTSKLEYPTNIRIIRVPCSGSVNPLYVLKAFEIGADGVLIAGCYEQTCHYRTGFTHMYQRNLNLKQVLEEIGINPNRLKIASVSAAENIEIKEIIERFVQEIKNLGPIGKEFEA